MGLVEDGLATRYGRQLLWLEGVAASGDARRLREALRSPQASRSKRLRGAIATSLGNSGSPAAVEPVVALLRDDPSSDVRCFAARALGLLRDPATIPSLLDALRDPTQVVRVSAVVGLGAFDDDEALAALARLRRDPDSTVRYQAAKSLAQSDRADAVHGLLGYMDDQSRHVRLAATAGLAKLGGPEALERVRQAVGGSRWIHRLLMARQLEAFERRIERRPDAPDQRDRGSARRWQ